MKWALLIWHFSTYGHSPTFTITGYANEQDCRNAAPAIIEAVWPNWKTYGNPPRFACAPEGIRP